MTACPSRTDETLDHPGWNQSPAALAGDLTTRQDLGGIANLRSQRDHIPHEEGTVTNLPARQAEDLNTEPNGSKTGVKVEDEGVNVGSSSAVIPAVKKFFRPRAKASANGSNGNGGFGVRQRSVSSNPFIQRIVTIFLKYTTFIGPGFMVAVAYIDPGNYATDVAAGAATRFKLLFIILMSNIFAVVLQSLAVRLGTVTGLNLAEHCRENLPRWMNYVLYIFAESAIIATDIAEVIGSAIALNLLLKVPLVAGCAITLVEVLLILFFYRPNGSLRRLQWFEYFVASLVLAVVVCFCIQLSLITDTSVGEVFRGYVPSPAVIEGQGIYLSCGILGATVMPHSLYLGSGIVQPRLRAFDENLTNTTFAAIVPSATEEESDKPKYRPSLDAIKYCLKYSTIELTFSLTIFALFVNSAILIVSGASLSSNESAQDADLFGIYGLLTSSIAPAAGTIFALALLFSGMSAGIVCTIAGQMVSEGQLRWTIAPWMRRLITRSISIVPSIIIAGAVGRDGLSAALNATQVCLSVILPFVTAPLIYFTCTNKIMTVGGRNRSNGSGDEEDEPAEPGIGMRSHWLVTCLAVCIWLVIAIMNVALLVLLGLGRT